MEDAFTLIVNSLNSLQTSGNLVERKEGAESVAKRQQALMALATSPLKQAGVMSFMMYMAGTQLHLFSILTTINGIYSPLNAIMNSDKGEETPLSGNRF